MDEDNTTWTYCSAFGTGFGKCDPGYSGTPYRTCSANGTWNPVQSYPCIPSDTKCPADTYNNAMWPPTLIGQYAPGVCLPGYVGNLFVSAFLAESGPRHSLQLQK